jgi:ABC-type lipoprotein export system ATPase subunit
MNPNNLTAGSTWKRWDLHVHSPASFGGDDYNTFIKNLAVSEADAIGINDYCTIAGYKKIVDLGGVPNKVIFPVLEFRMNNIVANRKGAPLEGGPKINFHLIFNNAPDLFTQIETFINSLKCFNNAGKETHLGSIPADDLDKITFNFQDVIKELRDVNLVDDCLIWLPYDEYGGIDEIDPDDNFFKLHLITQAQIMGSSREKQIDFFKWKDPKFTDEQYKKYFNHPKPCIKGSDSHELNYPFGRLKNEKSEPVDKFCWIKGDLTFNGLKQIVYEPDRVSISKEPELITRIKSFPHKFISKLVLDKEPTSRTSEDWFQNIEIPFNSGLIAIIGKKGNGKSAVADILGLCGNSRINKDDLSFLHKDKFRNPRSNKAKEFKAELHWADGNSSGEINLASDVNPLQEERIKYIPQNYLEKLCVNEEQKEFEEELKKIIFAHIPDPERLGQNTLDDLILVRQKAVEEGIEKLKLDIIRINKEVARFESKSKPAYRATILQEIANKEAELAHHDNNKPIEKPKPEEDTQQSEENKFVLEQVDARKASLVFILQQKRQLESEKGTNNISINELDAVKNELVQLDNLIKNTISEKKAILEKYGIEIKDVISHQIDVGKIAAKVDGFKARNIQITRSINGDEKSPSMAAQEASLSSSINELQGKLANAQKEYQEYLQAKEAWERRRVEIIGGSDKPSSLQFFMNEQKYIDESLSKNLEAARQERLRVARQIFSQKINLLSIYSTLYEPITKVLQKEAHFVEEYNIKVNASLSIKAFADRFISFVDQKRKGSFCGAVEGKEMIDRLLDLNTVATESELTKFINDLSEYISKDKRSGYKEEIRYLDEQLKRDIKPEDIYDFIYGLDYIEPQFKLQLGTKDLKELSPGERGAILLIFYLFLDIANKPLIIDQPEENLDNESIYYYLVHFIKRAKQKRQIILITHNPNLAVVCDADQIIHMTIDKQNSNKVGFISGAIENKDIASRVINILEGTKPAFDNRRLKYSSIVS